MQGARRESLNLTETRQRRFGRRRRPWTVRRPQVSLDFEVRVLHLDPERA
jgi:hypothetical protein